MIDSKGYRAGVSVVLAALLLLASAPRALAAKGDCGQPASGGTKPLTNDCLYVLRAAVGLVDCEPCVCDTDGNAKLAATDAQRCLRAAVGLPAALSCGPCPTTTTLGEATTTTAAPPTSTTSTTTTTTLPEPNPGCPGYVEWTTHAGFGAECESNTDCAAGTCDEDKGRCRTETRWDIGWVGHGHDTDVNEGAVERVKLDCDSEAAPCGVCEVEGLDGSGNGCRCANDTRRSCDDPLQPDADDCATCSGGSNAGKACSTDEDCPAGACAGAAVCECYASPPIPVSAGGTPFCFVPRFDSDLTGTVNVDTGAAALPATMRLRVYLGLGTTRPCPICGGRCASNPGTFCVRDDDCPTGDTCTDDPVANDGVRGGVCANYTAPDSAKPCDKGAFHSSFPAFTSGPQGGWYSLDCMPGSGTNSTGQGLLVRSVRTTQEVAPLSAGMPCFSESPFLCPCLLCSTDTSVPCTSNDDCSALPSQCSLSTNRLDPLVCTNDADCDDRDAGPCSTTLKKCTRATSIACNSNSDCTGKDLGTCPPPSCSSFGAGVQPSPNQCENLECADAGNGTGECATGPDTTFCAGVVQANGDGILSCSEDDHCSPGTVGIDARPCTLVQRQPCFLEPVVAAGSADATQPVLAETYCLGPTSGAGKNAALGLPGPARLTRQTSLRSWCDANPAKQYTPGVGGCDE